LLVASGLLGIVLIYSNYLHRILVGHGQIYQVNKAEFTNSVITFLGIVAFVWFLPFGVTGNLLAVALAAGAQTALLCWFLRLDLLPVCTFEQGFWREGLTYGIKAHALLLINYLNYRVDLLLLKHFSDDATVGVYSLAVGMAELMWLVPNATMAPLFSEVASSDADSRSHCTLLTVRWSLIFLGVLAAGAILVGRPFITLLYGMEYLPSYRPFLWLLPGICLLPIFKLLTVDLAGRGYPGYGTTASIAALVTNIIGNIFLIPLMGASGAALATSISYGCMAMLSFIFFKRITGNGLRDICVVTTRERELIRAKIKNMCI
jgi:O-antigen/teichoic acid export membrane protein